jgi:hypothetical protein
MPSGVLTLASRARCAQGRWTFGVQQYRTMRVPPCPNRTVPGSCFCRTHLDLALARVKAVARLEST